MIQKVGLTITKNNSNKITKITRKYVATSKNSFRNLIQEEGQAISKVKRFFTELADDIKANFRKISQKEELPKTNTASKSNGMYPEKMQKELEEQARQRNMVKWRKEENEKLIKKAGHSVSSGDIDQNGYLTSSGQKKLDNPTFKGHLDDLDFDETLRKELSNEEHGTNLDNLEHDFNDIIMNKQTPQVIEHDAEPSLMKALKNNHEQHLIDNEDHIADVANDYIDDLNEHLFG